LKRGQGLPPLSPHPFLRLSRGAYAALRMVFLDEGERFGDNRSASVASLRFGVRLPPECRSRSLWNPCSSSPEYPECLTNVGYRPTKVRLSRLMRSLPIEPWSNLSDGKADESLHAHVTAGNKLREALARGDALAMLAIGAIREFRDELGQEQMPIPQKAFILHSLKHPAEVESLRNVYGPTFFLVAVSSPRDLSGGPKIQSQRLA